MWNQYLKQNDIVGISSWSSACLSLVDAMQKIRIKNNIKVVQILGGIGNPGAEVHANRLDNTLCRIGQRGSYFPYLLLA